MTEYYTHIFDEMVDELDANIARIKAEIAREEKAFDEHTER